ncbi:MAG: sulfatase-like hydrolase/transferase, partial [Pirellulaceae bacterium]|nr:sulfatase-like hydrolase/transferase [Pirellulaceae bacterium]
MKLLTFLEHKRCHLMTCLVILGSHTGIIEAAVPKRPNFLILVSDDQRPDTIGALGNPIIQTPNLDRLAREGMTFTRAVCPFPLCVPSRAEILTGTSALENGVPSKEGRMKPDLVLWGDAMRSGGYHTWYCGKWMNDGSPKTRGYDDTGALFSSGGAGAAGKQPRYNRNGRLITGYRGWTFKNRAGKPELKKGIGLVGETSRYIADGAIALLEREIDRPFFLHVNFTAPHDPLVIPPGYEDKYDPARIPLPKNFAPQHPFNHGNAKGRDEQLLPLPRTKDDIRDQLAAYYAVIDDMDTQIGRILQKLKETGRRDNTIIIFTSDHGLAIGSHGLLGKQNMYEHTVGVPFIIAGKGIPRGRRSSACIYLRDMFPTTCELAKIDIPATVTAQSFASILRGEKPAISRQAAFAYFYDHQRMIRTDRWKLIFYPQLDRYQL